jgi:hypothetical protein
MAGLLDKKETPFVRAAALEPGGGYAWFLAFSTLAVEDVYLSHALTGGRVARTIVLVAGHVRVRIINFTASYGRALVFRPVLDTWIVAQGADGSRLAVDSVEGAEVPVGTGHALHEFIGGHLAVPIDVLAADRA